MEIEKYSFGIGNRFGMQGRGQLKAVLRSAELGVSIVPVWNKSFREHQIIGTIPQDVRNEAEATVSAIDYKGSYYVDADHINAGSVEAFIEPSDFFTLDVASYIGQEASRDEIQQAKEYLNRYTGELRIPALENSFDVQDQDLDQVLKQYLLAIRNAGELYRMLVERKGADNFVAEVSMDEVEKPQSPLELFFILALIAREGIKAQTIAPKFSGRFNKGVDYEGDIDKFKSEFEMDLLVIKYAIQEFGLPDNLKLSIHSGSDKFSIYPIMGELIRKHDMGIHVKTAGTTWLEEVIGLAIGHESSLMLVKDIYAEAYNRREELCSPYADVIDIDTGGLPDPADVYNWTGEHFASSIRHIPDNPLYNLNMRQLLHVGYKLAAEKGESFSKALTDNRDIIERQVEENIYTRHIKRLFHNFI